MDSIFLFLEEASPLQLSLLAAAFIVWFLGGSLLKKQLLKRLQSQPANSDKNIQLEDIRFEDIIIKEWTTFAVVSIVSVGLGLFSVYMPV